MGSKERIESQNRLNLKSNNSIQRLLPVATTFSKLKDLKEEVESNEVSYREDLKEHTEKDDIIDVVTKYYKRSFGEICYDKRRPMKEKKITIYLMKRFTDLTNNDIGKIFGMSYSAISKAENSIKRLMGGDKNIKREVEGLVSTFKV